MTAAAVLCYDHVALGAVHRGALFQHVLELLQCLPGLHVRLRLPLDAVLVGGAVLRIVNRLAKPDGQILNAMRTQGML